MEKVLILYCLVVYIQERLMSRLRTDVRINGKTINLTSSVFIKKYYFCESPILEITLVKYH